MRQVLQFARVAARKASAQDRSSGQAAIAPDAEPASDFQLVLRLRARDPGAMGTLYDRYGNLAYSIILRIVGSHPLAEDLVQETFLRVWTRICLFDGDRRALRPWVVAIARNQALDYIRSSTGRTQRLTSGSNRLEQLSLAAAQHSSYWYDNSFAPVNAAFQKLTVNQRAVINLAYFQGMSQSEIALSLGKPLGTVKTWLRSGLYALRTELLAAGVPA